MKDVRPLLWGIYITLLAGIIFMSLWAADIRDLLEVIASK